MPKPAPTTLAKRRHEWRKAVEDWFFLALLGVIMSLISVTTDVISDQMQRMHLRWFERMRDDHWLLSFSVWTSFVVVAITVSVTFVHYVGVQAIGSGIPELKTVLRGVVLKEFLSIRTLISKIVGLILCHSSGLPMGKEGPFVHIAAIVANFLSRFLTGSQLENESRSWEMLAAGCAVGVACTFSAPVGGVLFSIEVTSTYFAVRNYWRGFFGAVCSAVLFRLLKMFEHKNTPSLSVEAHFQTHFPTVDPFLPVELPIFALMGAILGLLGAGFIDLHRKTVLFLRKNHCSRVVFQKYWLVYPLLVSFAMSSITFPHGIGKYLGGPQKFSRTLSDFFLACTWSQTNMTEKNFCTSSTPWTNWRGLDHDIDIFIPLITFQVVFFFFCILLGTLPIPAGLFLPVFVLGAAFGRMVGEAMAQWYPQGLDADMPHAFLCPGVYAVVGSAAFAGAMTHTVSVAVIVFEMTGQLVHILPVMTAVLIANAVCAHFQPSLYDSIIKLKKLPYLADITPSNIATCHTVQASQFMTTARYLTKESDHLEINDILNALPNVSTFPVVDGRDSMSLIGTVNRSRLRHLLDTKADTKSSIISALHTPMQVVQDTSLLKIHSLFGLLPFHRIYVTTQGRLVGVIGMKELQLAIEAIKSGQEIEVGQCILPAKEQIPSEDDEDLDDQLNPCPEVVRSRKKSVLSRFKRKAVSQ